MRRKRQSDGQTRNGSVVIEFTLITTLVLLPLLVGAADFALYLNARHIVARAANEGVMLAVQGLDPAPRVLEYLALAGLSPAKAAVTLTASDAVPVTGTRMTLTASYEVEGLVAAPFVPALERLTQVRVQAVGRHI